MPDGCVGVDIGPKSRSAFAAALQGCKSVLWNGPMGVAEAEAFSSGTEEVAFAVTQVGQSGATVVIGGAIPRMLAWHVCMH